MYQYTSNIHLHDTRYDTRYSTLRTPKCKTTRSQHTIKFHGAKIWNTILEEINVNCAIGTFKKRLRILLLTKHSSIFDKALTSII